MNLSCNIKSLKDCYRYLSGQNLTQNFISYLVRANKRFLCSGFFIAKVWGSDL